jgi:DinB superfamily
MTTLELITLELTRLHKALDRSLEGLTPEQLHQVPAGHPSANTIAWGVWHYVRTEDNVVRFILQARRPIVWAEGGYAEKLGLPPVAQGTGMTTQEAQGLRIKDLGVFREYVGKVWASTGDYLAKLDPAALSHPVTIKPLGEMPAVRALAEVCITHGFTHFGEIELARTLVGAKPVSGG